MTDRVCVIRQRDYYELAVRRETETLRDAGYGVDLICLEEAGHDREETINGVHLYRLPLNRQKGNILRYIYDYFSFLLLAGIKVTQLHFKHRYKVIQVNTMPDFLVFATLIPRMFGAKVIVFMKEPTPELGGSLYQSELIVKILKIVEQAALRYAHKAFTVTLQLKEVYVSRGADPDKIDVVLNGPDDSHFAAINEDLQADPDYFTLICHGAIEERYGQDTILQAVNIARAQVPNLRLRLMGTGSYIEEVKAMIRDLKLEDCVEFLGWVSEETLARELHQADVGLVAQKSTSYANLVHTNKMYEYIIFNKPAIISRLSSTHHYFPEDSMYYFEPSDPQSLAKAIIDLANNPQKRQNLLANAKKLYEKYSWINQSQIFLNTYQQLTQTSSPKQGVDISHS